MTDGIDSTYPGTDSLRRLAKLVLVGADAADEPEPAGFPRRGADRRSRRSISPRTRSCGSRSRRAPSRPEHRSTLPRCETYGHREGILLRVPVRPLEVASSASRVEWVFPRRHPCRRPPRERPRDPGQGSSARREARGRRETRRHRDRALRRRASVGPEGSPCRHQAWRTSASRSRSSTTDASATGSPPGTLPEPPRSPRDASARHAHRYVVPPHRGSPARVSRAGIAFSASSARR